MAPKTPKFRRPGRPLSVNLRGMGSQGFCPQNNVKNVHQSPMYGPARDTLGTLLGHSGAPNGKRDTPQDTPSDTPVFGDALGDSRETPVVVYFRSSLRADTAKTLICTESGVSADSRKSAKKCGKPHFSKKMRTFYAKSAVFRTFWHSVWNRQKPHFLCTLMFLLFGL